MEIGIDIPKLPVFFAIVLYAFFILFYISKARKGIKLFLRRIPGIEAVDEAIGRATEMGRPILYIPGLSSIDDVATIASLNILSRVARKAGEYETDILVPNRNPVVYTITKEVVRQAYSSIGRPDLFKDENIFYVTDSQFGYTAAVCAIMVREKTATNFFMGMFWAESLLLAETGASTGAIQIAGTDALNQLPFFITACDYTLIGEEFYCASAYLSEDPVLVSTIRAQDTLKFIIGTLLLLGTGLGLIGKTHILEFLFP